MRMRWCRKTAPGRKQRRESLVFLSPLGNNRAKKQKTKDGLFISSYCLSKERERSDFNEKGEVS